MGEEVRAASDLIRWLKLLALPAWTKVDLFVIMLLALFNALALRAGDMGKLMLRHE